MSGDEKQDSFGMIWKQNLVHVLNLRNMKVIDLDTDLERIRLNCYCVLAWIFYIYCSSFIYYKCCYRYYLYHFLSLTRSMFNNLLHVVVKQHSYILWRIMLLFMISFVLLLNYRKLLMNRLLNQYIYTLS